MIISANSKELNSMSGEELVAEHNRLAALVGGKPVFRFSSRAVGTRRIIALLAEHPELQKPPANPEPPRRGGRTHRRDMPFSGKVKPHRCGTRRAKMIEMLRQGCRLEDICREIGWHERQASEAIRLVHRYLGYGIQEDESGVIRIVTE